jgi:tetratricopeptide repeat protein 21B
MNQD